MGSDTSRNTFDPRNDFSGVFLQQGRAVLDADWNEMVQMFMRRIRTETVDTIGRAVVPIETPVGFEIRFNDDGELEYGRGRFYLDGYLCESPGQAEFDGAPVVGIDPPIFDRARTGNDGPEGVLDEMISQEVGDFVPLDAQPYWPTAEGLPEPDAAGNTAGPHIAYLVCWDREVHPVQHPDLLDPALVGIDTTTRTQTVWQIRLLEVPQGTSCETPDGQIQEWFDLIQPSSARLSVDTIDIEAPEDPCIVPPSDGYVGRENQHYRVQIHDFPDDGVPRIKFSRENGSVIAAVEAIDTPANMVTVDSIGRDEKLSFKEGDWVELTDDHREFDHRSGRMLRIVRVLELTRQIEFDREIDSPDVGTTGEDGSDLIPTGLGSDTLAARHTRLIRWDQTGIYEYDNGDDPIDLDETETEGLIPMPTDGSAVRLEAGITIALTTDGPGDPHAMDRWSFFARTAGTQVEELVNAPPQGTQRHYARLAVVDPASGFVDDCRIFWPPAFEGEPGGGEEVDHCGCTVCVTPELHNSGELTIQAAINQVDPPGGTVCLEAGAYFLSSPIEIADRNGIRLKGQGIGTTLAYFGNGAAIRVADTTDVILDRFTLFVRPEEDNLGNLPPSHGVTAVNTSALMLSRLSIGVIVSDAAGRTDHAIALDGAQIGTVVENCVALAAIGLGSRSSFDETTNDIDEPSFVAFAEMRVRDCTLFGARDGVHFDRVAFNLAGAGFTGNLVLAGNVGMHVNWVDLPIASALIEGATVIGGLFGLVLGAGDVRVKDCEITAGQDVGVGIHSVSNLAPDAATDLRVISTGIADLGGTGISLAGRHGSVLIKQNIIRRCGAGGIAVSPQAQINHLSIDNNHIADIAGAVNNDRAAGIALSSTENVHVAGNMIMGVGELGQSGELYTGIAGEALARVTISDNEIARIGPDNPEVRAIGIMLRHPFGELALRGNRIEARRGQVEFATWSAIEVGMPFEDIPELDDDGGRLPIPAAVNLTSLGATDEETVAFVTLSEDVLRVSANGVAHVFDNRQATVAVTGTQVTADLALLRPMVTVFHGSLLSLDVSHNQLTQGGPEFDNLPPLMVLGGHRVSLSSNTLVHRRIVPSIRVRTGGINDATALGNITAEPIQLNGGNLPAPFNQLNILA
ncbi:DUF6519 domain-containing protein [Ruegeria arenilitoris]|uniref:DUF6519 domain-containing protein n=1 Tax=Ruegeria arenilitoris TaxID=1173585 RepID=UPI00147B9FC6|nr:DUF6519 domain-containing protein [Ruegeria arenilitoris]